MKKIMFVALCMALSYSLSAQDKEDIKNKETIFFGKAATQDRIAVDVFTDMWIMKGAAADSIDPKQINLGVSWHYKYEILFGKSNFSFAAGLGFSLHNMKSDAIPINYTYDSSGNKVYGGSTVFTKIPLKSTDGSQDINVKNNKFTAIYVDIPFEFRYRLRNNAFKFYLGGKLGLLLGSYNTYNGDNYNEDYPTSKMRIREYAIANVNKVHYGITLRTGWKWIQVYGYYSLSHLFKKDKGPEMYPISVGLTISPY